MNEEVKVEVVRQNLIHIHSILDKAPKKPKLFVTLKRTYELMNLTNLAYFSKIIEDRLGDSVDGLIFETLADAMTARILGVKKRVILLYYLTYEEAALASSYNIEITCSDKDWLHGLLTKYPSTPFKFNVYYDVGIGRQGLVDETELRTLMQQITVIPSLTLCGLGTRFNPRTNGIEMREGLWKKFNFPADVRRATMHGYIAEQKARFGSFVESIRPLYPNIEIHAACSKEIINEQFDIFYDIVRVGILCFSTLLADISIYAPVLSIKTLPKNFSIGYYGLSGIAEADTKVAYIKYYKFLNARYYYKGKELTSLKLSDPFGLIIDESMDIEIGSQIEIRPIMTHYT